LTSIDYNDIVTKFAREMKQVFRGNTITNSERTASAPLFSGSLTHPRSRIPAENEMSMADNLPQKQQEQRNCHKALRALGCQSRQALAPAAQG
jgi:hypothetical protein